MLHRPSSVLWIRSAGSSPLSLFTWMISWWPATHLKSMTSTCRLSSHVCLSTGWSSTLTSVNLVSPLSISSATALAPQALPLWKIVWKLYAIFLFHITRLPCKNIWDLLTFTVAFVLTVRKSSIRCTCSSKGRILPGSGHLHARLLSSKVSKHYKPLPCWHNLILQH